MHRFERGRGAGAGGAYLLLPSIQHSERIEDHDLAIERYQRLVELAKQRRANILGSASSG